MTGPGGTETFDVVVVGAGFAGLYLIKRMRDAGFSAVAVEAADDVGGTWYWNRYPGARCDIESIDYSYSWDPELDAEWEWSERYATQPEILRYLGHVADRHDLRRDIRFETRVTGAVWDDDTRRWTITTDTGSTFVARHYAMAVGTLSLPKQVDIPGADSFEGDVYFTGRWPHEPVDFTGKTVAVIGTGSSAIQSIPLIAAEADHLTVFQRTANFSVPAHNGPHDADKLAEFRRDRDAYRESQRRSRIGVPREIPLQSALAVSAEERTAAFERGWDEGGLLAIPSQYNDIGVNRAANQLAADFVHDKIRSIVDDPETAETLCPTGYPFATKRLCVDTDYYATYNRDNVRLVDLRSTPIQAITPSGIDIATPEGTESIDVDALVYAIGFDALTGPVVAVDIEGRDGMTLRDEWEDGPRTYLGLMTRGFPNLYMITGPQSPSVLSNMVVSIEQHVDFVTDLLVAMRDDGFDTVEPTEVAEAGWAQHNADCVAISLYEEANSWYMGANVEGKPRVFLPYIGGVDTYRATCERVVEEGYLGFELTGDGRTRVNDGVVNRLQPDVALMLQTMAELGLPPLESMDVAGARQFMEVSGAMNPPGPDVGEVIDGTLPGAGGDLDYRLYRPATAGPHPVVCYFHGGGWVLGSATSDDAFCRDMCVRADVAVVSVDYRHAPESVFPAAPDDAFAALEWVAANAESLGGAPGPLVVAGWSAGANLATVAARRARDAGGPRLAGQLLVCPVTDLSTQSASYAENGDGYVLTRSLMEWFAAHYAPDVNSPDASPLLAELSGLAPAAVFTSEFDPLRDEGNAYARALADAGVDLVAHVQCRGQTHTSLLAVNVLISPARHRQEMAEALRALFASDG